MQDRDKRQLYGEMKRLEILKKTEKKGRWRVLKSKKGDKKSKRGEREQKKGERQSKKREKEGKITCYYLKKGRQQRRRNLDVHN